MRPGGRFRCAYAQTFRYYADLAVHTRRREPIAVSGFEAHTLRVP
jgi:hypothetical protein